MIVVQSSDLHLRRAVVRAAQWEEDVIMDARRSREAIESGLPRLVIRDALHADSKPPRGIPHLDLSEEGLRRWESDRRAQELPLTRLDFLSERLALEIAAHTRGPSWVDQALAEISRAAGARLPRPLRALGGE